MQSATATFVVLKGYHVGSKWFAEELNALGDCRIAFEFEDCVESAQDVLRYLQICECPVQCSNTSCGVEPLMPCSRQRARGASFGFRREELSGKTSHLLAQELVPRLTRDLAQLHVVLHTRTNLVKLAYSSIRAGCPGTFNHLRLENSAMAPTPSPLRIPPELLLSETIRLAANQAALRHFAQGLGPVAYDLRYEALQLDIHHEIVQLLRSVGAPPGSSWPPPPTRFEKAMGGPARVQSQQRQQPQQWARGGRRLQLVKSSADDLRQGLDNFEEVHAFFAKAVGRWPVLGCLLPMLLEPMAQVFPGDCEAALVDDGDSTLREAVQWVESQRDHALFKSCRNSSAFASVSVPSITDRSSSNFWSWFNPHKRWWACNGGARGTANENGPSEAHPGERGPEEIRLMELINWVLWPLSINLTYDVSHVHGQ